MLDKKVNKKKALIYKNKTLKKEKNLCFFQERKTKSGEKN